MWEGYGCACRDYAFAVRSGRLSAVQMDTNYLAQCESEITNRAADLRLWSSQNAYGTSLSPDQKGFYDDTYGVAYYFGGDNAFDIAVADRIHPDPTNAATMIENLNYEAGCNPLNMSFITGLGWTRQRIIVDQYAWNNPLALVPPSGIPVGNIVDSLQAPGGFPYENLQDYAFPPYGSGTTNVFQLYDRWADSYNVIIEFVALNTARHLAAAGYLAASTPLTNQFWQRASASITFPSGPPRFGIRTTAQLSTAVDLSQAQILWDPGQASWGSLGQDPAFGASAVFIPTTVGDNRTLQAEAVLPDGRRVFATTNFSVWDPINGGTTNTLDTNTIALYHFDDPSHPFADATTNHYDLAMVGQVVLTNNANWMSSPTGYVARFSSGQDYLQFLSINPTNILPSNSPTPLTIEARIYPRAYNGNNNGGIVFLAQDFNSGSPPTASQWGLYYLPNETPNAPAVYANATVMTGLDNSGWSQLVALNTWHSFKMTFDTNGITRCYIDGVLAGQPSTNAPIYDHSKDWTITLGNFDGDIDEVRISNIVR
jgi:Concanavalin A-like lectin/glucanases superfamily